MKKLSHGLWILFIIALTTPVIAAKKKAETAPANNAGSANSAAPATQPWHMSGDLEEACKCNGACPCWFGNMPTRMNCGGHVAAFIDKGAYGNTPLDGLAFVRTGQSQDGKTMLENMGNWTFDYLYIDEKATPDQRKALEQIAWATMPKMSKDTQVKYVPITRTVDGKEHKVQVGSVGGFSAHLVEGGMGGTTKIVNPPGADPMHAEYEQGETSSFTFSDANQNWDQKGSNYMFAKYDVNSDQYAKYNAEMEKKIAAMKAEKEKAAPATETK